MSDEVSEPDRRRTSTDLKWGIAAVALPALSYLIVYSVNLGQARFYGIPDSLVAVSSSDVLRVAFTLATAAASWMIAVRILALSSPAHPGIREYAALPLLLTLLAILSWWTNGFNVAFWVTFAIAAAVILGAVLLLLSRARKAGGLDAALEEAMTKSAAELNAWSPRAWSMIFQRALELRPLSLVAALLITVYFVGFGTMVGKGIAARETDYLVPSERESAVVLMVNGGNAIVGTVDDKGRIGDAFEVAPLSELGFVESRSIGPLLPKK